MQADYLNETFKIYYNGEVGKKYILQTNSNLVQTFNWNSLPDIHTFSNTNDYFEVPFDMMKSNNFRIIQLH